MRVAIHQVNFIPWMGYFNKIAKSDLFILMDEVQLTDAGTGQRNRILGKNGQISFLTIPFNKKNYMHRPSYEVEINQNVDWQKRHLNFLQDAYHKFPHWNEVWEAISPLYTGHFDRLNDVNEAAIRLIMELLAIHTPLIHQHEMEYDRAKAKSDLVLELCKAANADTYLSGNGSRKYMQIEDFKKAGVNVQYQTFQHPVYPQKYAQQEPVIGLSILDVLLNCGIEETRRMFWENLCENEVNE